MTESDTPCDEPLNFTVFSRPGCHLCEDMVRVLKSIRPCLYRSLSIRNIEDDRDAQRKYAMDIPVLQINGVDAFRYHVTEDELTLWLKHPDRKSYTD